MKNLFLLIFIFLTYSAHAQAFHYGIAVSLNRTGNFLHNDGTVPATVQDTYKRLENQKFGYSLHFFARHTLGARAALWTGIGYATTGYVTERTKLDFILPEPTAPDYLQVSYTHYDIIVPILFKYNLSKRKSTLYVIAGPSPQVKLARIQDLRFEYPGGRKEHSTSMDRSTNYRAVNVDGTFGIGYDLALSAKKHVFLQPTFDCNLLGTFKKAALNRRLYSIGLQLGMTFG